jgi:P pilus assembly protein, pilin FimA
MKKYCIAGLFLLSTSCAWADVVGTCTTTTGTHLLNLNFSKTNIAAKDNIVGKSMIDIAEATAADTYKVTCTCDSAHRLTKKFTAIYYTADPSNSLIYDKKISGISFYNLNEYLDVGVKIFIKNVGYTAVPFEHVSNQSTASHACDSKTGIELDTGSSAMLSFYIKKSITGEVTIPLTEVALVYGGISSNLSRGDVLANVKIKGSITAPQECDIDDGQIIKVDFGEIPASEFSGTRGAAVMSKKVKKTVSVSCTGLERTQKVSADFNATSASIDGSMIKTSNSDVGIKVYDENDKEISVNGGDLQTDMGKTSVLGKTTGTITFSAAPASMTGSRPKPGSFTADATLTLEFTN